MQNASIPNFANTNQFKVMIGDAAFVVPDSVESVSPAGALTGGISSSGLSPVNLFNTKRATIGGYLFVAFSDAVGPTALDFQTKINPGDSVVLTVAASVATVQITDVSGAVRTPFSFAYTAVGGIQGYYA
jgi:hypothetical protein